MKNPGQDQRPETRDQGPQTNPTRRLWSLVSRLWSLVSSLWSLVPSLWSLKALWFAGGFALLLGLGRDTILGWQPRPRELPRLDGATGRPWVDDAFVRAGAYQEIGSGRLPAHIQAVSSWLGTDAAQGRAESAWFKATRRTVHVGVAGYPQQPGCRLWVEFRAADGAVTRVDCPLADPREQWGVWEIRRPADAIAVRIIGEDRATAAHGWLAFSHPFRAWPGVLAAIYQHLQIWTTLALVLTLVWAPGLCFCRRADGATPTPARHVVALIGAGPLLLAALGVIVWAASPWLRPQPLGLVLVTAAWAALGLRARRHGFAWPAGDALRRVFAILTLVVVAVVAKSFHSLGPEGELFRGTVSRNFEMADRIDSRFSFYVVQAAANRQSPAAPETERLFFPWTFFSRGPLAGLAALPIVLATGGAPSADLPEQRWQPFDPTGFAAYRITLIVLASTVVVALFLVLVPLVGDRWAGIAAGLVALSPFGVHEMMFTWPKWAATAWLVASFGLVHARRPLAAGLTLGVGFLFHPLVLLWGPWLALWLAGRTAAEKSVPALGRAWLRFGAGAALLVLPWMALGAWMPHLSTTPLAGQGGFFRYFARADWHYATWETWWHTRWMNFANTFVPLHGYLADASFHHPKLNSAYEASGRLVKFSQLWWNSLPFALGLGLWAVSVAALARAARTLAAPIALLLVGPALLVTAYWGMDPLGLMRECGHPLFVAAVALVCVAAVRHGGWLRRLLAHPGVPWLQLPETALMLWLTTLLNPRPWAADYTHLDPLALFINVAALAAAAWLLMRARATWADLPQSSAPPETALPPIAWRRFAAAPPAWLVLALGAVVIALRRPDQIRTPQLWAEDGIFFFQAHEIGLPAFGLELAGYSQLAPRLIAALSQAVDPLWVPHVFVASGLAITLYVMSRVLSPRCPLPLRPWAALAIVLVPDAAEVLLNANNVQWILGCGGVLLLISREPARLAEWLHDALAALCFGLTGPFSVLLAPFFAARALLRRTRASAVLAALVALCAIVQATSIALHPQPPPAGGTFEATAMASFPGLRILGVLLFGAWQPASLPWPLAAALTVALAGLLVFLVRRESDTRPLRLILGLVFAALLASTLYRCWHSMPLLCVPGAASRYIYPLQLLVLWLLLASLRDRSRPVRLLCAGAALWMIAVNLPRLRIAPVPDQRWADYAPKLRAGEEVTIPINPEGWKFTFPARPR